ncbi:MAG: hypothetical protein HY698_22185 [Deltaproteobacteria bacterium]|nr:hypothetical protein [Deltaproteobacteria bacterium]
MTALVPLGTSLGESAALARGLGTSRPPAIRDGEHVRVKGTQFVLGERPFHFVGANVSVMHGEGSRLGTLSTLDAAARDGLAVVRVWAFGEAPEDSPDWRKLDAFRLGPRGWLEESFQHLDRVLAAARERNLRVILVLGNRWSAYGGVPEYLRWAGLPVKGAEATEDAGAGGICLYGGATGSFPIDPALASGLPGRIRLTLHLTSR